MNRIFQHTLRKHQYYPTPTELVRSILESMDDQFHDAEEINFLEPCAGDGAICREVQKFFTGLKTPVNIHCIEIEEVFQNSLKGQGYHVIGKDFETYNGQPFYDIIIMNPPFSKGAKFLLKAYDLLNADGRLICILNAETVKNPCNRDRELLKALIERVGDVKYLSNAFSNANRKTDVEIAVVYLKKPLYENEFDYFGGIQHNILSDEERIREELKNKVEGTQIMSFDKVDYAVNVYRNCVEQIFKGIDTITKIKNSLKYLENEAREFNIEPEKFIEIMFEKEQEEAKEQAIKTIRKMIWSFVLKFCQMEQYLYHKQRNDFYSKMEKGSATIPFTKENILQFFENIYLQREKYFQAGIEDLFNEITSYHQGNTIHREGWKTNKNWKINKKIIVDWGIEFDDYSKHGGRYGFFRVRYGREWIEDLDKIVRKIEPELASGYWIKDALRNCFDRLGKIHIGEKFENTCETPYFRLKFFKKGTLHITFKDQKILDKLNIIGAKLRQDLGYDDFGKRQNAKAA